MKRASLLELRGSRYIGAPLPPIPAWQKEFGDYKTLREYEQLKKPLQRTVDTWPQELSEVVHQRWHKRVGPKPDVIAASTGAPVDWSYLNNMKAANAELRQLELTLSDTKLDVTSTDGDIADYARERAARCQLHPKLAHYIVKMSGLQPPAGRNMTQEGKLLRMQDEKWWRMRLRATFGQRIENTMRGQGMVCRTKKVYVTDWSVKRRVTHKKNMAKALKAARITSDHGEQLSLFEVSEHSVSNPALRRGELMTRARGFEEIARQEGHTWIFVTTTCPSAFHTMNYDDKRNLCFENKLYTGSSVRDGQKWQVKQWAKCRAKFKRKNILFYGFRIAEPHHDGTVHWHLLLFCAGHHVEDIKLIIREHWLSEYADERGADEHRVVFKDEDENMPGSSAAGYIAKYIGKNIDGFEVGKDYEAGTDSESTALRVEAWATTHRIRQFQQVGGPPVTLWRELRRLRERVADDIIEKARQATTRTEDKKASFSDFIQACGGITVGRMTTVRIWKKPCQELGKYREPKADVIKGVESEFSRIMTRIKNWVVKWFSPSLSSLGLVPITVRSIFDGKIDANVKDEQKTAKGPPQPVEGSLEWWKMLRSGAEKMQMTRLSLLWNH